MGNVYFNTPARDITLELAKAALEDRERAKQIDLTKLSPRDFLDSFETKNLSDMLYEWYPNYYEKQPMPKSLFGNRFGYDMQKQIGSYMRNFYTGKISENELEAFFEECCLAMRKHVASERWTSGDDEMDQQKIVGEIYEIFAKENARAASYANNMEGEAMNMLYGGRGMTGFTIIPIIIINVKKRKKYCKMLRKIWQINGGYQQSIRKR